MIYLNYYQSQQEKVMGISVAEVKAALAQESAEVSVLILFQ